MKNSSLLRLGALVFFLFLTSLAHAQTQPAALPGYWNVETNLTTRDYTLVRFYNGQDQLVYEENLPNLCLDLSRRRGQCRRTKSQLDATLQQVLRTPADASSSSTLLATQFGQDRRVQRVYATR
ncbi:MAG: hypothetical protein JWR44_2747 [Hymenobacter sp.]|jgi:hypothetical protein|nr:hypothetical protein [Hymenobacter sp.]